MSISVSDYLGIDKELFEQTGAFDAILDVDAKLFIDPVLLRDTHAPELKNSYQRVHQHFEGILKLLQFSSHYGDAYWRNAQSRFQFHEVQGLCIGYSSRSTAGSGIGLDLSTQLLTTAKKIVDAGIIDPEIFELMGLFEDGIGADRISDMLASIILEDLLRYSERIFDELGLEKYRLIHINEQEFKLPINEFNQYPIILIPKDILRDLPMVHELSDIEDVVSFSRALRAKLNQLLGVSWKEAKKLRKSDYKYVLLNEPEILEELLKTYRGLPASTYDFEHDPAGEVLWYQAGREFAEKYPLDLVLPSFPSPDDILHTVLQICEKFKQNIENNGLDTLLYRDESCTVPKKEEASQKIFYGIADAYCEANNLDLSPETNSGRGAVDFKISRGYKRRVLVETKLATNSRLLHGFDTQIEEYQKAEKSRHSIYLVIEVSGSENVVKSEKKRIESLKKRIQEKKKDGGRVPEVIFIDGKHKLSASKF